MPIVSEIYEVVIGVDTHAASHTLAAVDARTGALRSQATFPTSSAGLARARQRVARQAPAQIAGMLIVVEGIGSYGAIFTYSLVQSGYTVVEAPAPNRGDQRGRGKTYSLDAVRMARGMLATQVRLLRVPRGDGHRAALRILVVAREQMTRERTRLSNTLTALPRTVDLGIDARRPLSMARIRTVAAWRSRVQDVATMTARGESVRLARRYLALIEELAANCATILAMLTAQPEMVIRAATSRRCGNI